MAINETLKNELLQAARHAAKSAYAPYSNFTVGAALLCSDGTIFEGCNVENASFGLCICAERTAATTAVARGNRQWSAIAVVSPTGVSPCGACRQFLAEFNGGLDIVIGFLDETKPVDVTDLKVLLPNQMNLGEHLS